MLVRNIKYLSFLSNTIKLRFMTRNSYLFYFLLLVRPICKCFNLPLWSKTFVYTKFLLHPVMKLMHSPSFPLHWCFESNQWQQAVRWLSQGSQQSIRALSWGRVQVQIPREIIKWFCLSKLKINSWTSFPESERGQHGTRCSLLGPKVKKDQTLRVKWNIIKRKGSQTVCMASLIHETVYSRPVHVMVSCQRGRVLK